jgi:hypothetical protein
MIRGFDLASVLCVASLLASAAPARAHCAEHTGNCGREWVAIGDPVCEEPTDPRELGVSSQEYAVYGHYCVTTDAVKIDGWYVKPSTCNFVWTCTTDADCAPRFPADISDENRAAVSLDGWVGAPCILDPSSPRYQRCDCLQAACTVCAADRPGDPLVQAREQACQATPERFETLVVEDDARCPARVPCDGPREGGAWASHGTYVTELVGVLREYLDAGRIGGAELGAIAADGAASSCGF